jgi:hypothetical protein
MMGLPCTRKLPDGDKLADTAIGQEQEGKGSTSVTKRQVWPSLRNVLSADEASGIGTKIEQGKKSAPARHPPTPPSTGVLKSAGPAGAAADRASDEARWAR